MKVTFEELQFLELNLYVNPVSDSKTGFFFTEDLHIFLNNSLFFLVKLCHLKFILIFIEICSFSDFHPTDNLHIRTNFLRYIISILRGIEIGFVVEIIKNIDFA